MNNTYTEYEYKLNNGKIIKTYKGFTICPDCQAKFELETTAPELFGKAVCIKCFKKKDNDTFINPDDNELQGN